MRGSLLILLSSLIVVSYAKPCFAEDYSIIYGECMDRKREARRAIVYEACTQAADAGNLSPAEYDACVSRWRNARVHESAIAECKAEAQQATEPVKKMNDPKFIGSPSLICPPGTDCGTGIAGGAGKEKDEGKESVGGGTKDPDDKVAGPKVPEKPSGDGKKDEETKPRAVETPSPSPSPSPSFSTVGDEIEAQKDIAACRNAQSSANRCCGDPMSCSHLMNSSDQQSLRNLMQASSSSGGLADYCRQLSSLTYNAGNVNSALAAVCTGEQLSCTNVCGNLAQKYAGKLAACGGCASKAIFESALASLRSAEGSCQGLTGRANQLAMTGLGMASDQGLADACRAQASAMAGGPPGSMNSGRGLPLGNSKAQELNDTAQVRKGQVGFQDSLTARKNREFNLVDASSGFKGYQNQVNVEEPQTQAPRAQATVPNNTGGAIPGTGADPRAQAATQQAGQPKIQPASADSITNIERGFQAGGGYSPPVQNTQVEDPGAGGRHFASITGAGNQFDPGIDLRQFLPGGSRAAGRGIRPKEINAKEENIFLRISRKMDEKCRLGVLWQCR